MERLRGAESLMGFDESTQYLSYKSRCAHSGRWLNCADGMTRRVIFTQSCRGRRVHAHRDVPQVGVMRHDGRLGVGAQIENEHKLVGRLSYFRFKALNFTSGTSGGYRPLEQVQPPIRATVKDSDRAAEGARAQVIHLHQPASVTSVKCVATNTLGGLGMPLMSCRNPPSNRDLHSSTS
jgi:hypothetical protein